MNQQSFIPLAKRVGAVLFAANAMVFGLVLLAYLLLIPSRGFDGAEFVWKNTIVYLIAWIVSLPICWKYLKVS